MKWSPKIAPGAGELTGRKLIDVPRAYHAPGFVQSGIIWRHWEREAARLFSLFWRTADDRHPRAFAAHVKAMRSYGGPRK
jgi:hypothetical protein